METIADKSRTKEIIERLQSIMDSASPVPLASGKVMIYKDEVQSLLTELKTQIDMEIKTYHEVNDRRGKIINEAKKEAERIIYQAENSASRMRVNKRTTNVDPVDFSAMSQEELDALDNANEIYGASLIYTDEMLTEVTNLISDTYQNMKNDYEIILSTMEEKLNTLAENKAELMNGLSEMDGKDRSQQILEIGQLLSDELFNARMNSHRNPDMYDDGSMQLTLDLKTEQEIKAQQAEEKAREAVEAAVEAEAAAKEAEEALAEMTAQRDALMEEVSKMKNENKKTAVTEMADKGKADLLVNADNLTADKIVASIEAGASNKTQIDADSDKSFETKEAAEVEKDGQIDVTEDKASNVVNVHIGATDTKSFENVVADEEEDDDEEYEIVYVTEDELEEGEEYEIEYVDDDEFEEGVDAESFVNEVEKEAAASLEEDDTAPGRPLAADKKQEPSQVIAKPEDRRTIIGGQKTDGKLTEVNIAVNPGRKPSEADEGDEAASANKNNKDNAANTPDLENVSGDEDMTIVPMIPHFNRSQKIASVPSEKVARMASAITTDKKYSGLISRAVSEGGQADKHKKADDVDDSDMKMAKKPGRNDVHEANMYVQEKFEITEF
ncbi:MAG: hypothetical protein IJ661_02650 [Lachnospiraceae bacterium]|nr:hypothetical protein [Lachnospiraceae bacterium]